jgi:hypothetical protein
LGLWREMTGKIFINYRRGDDPGHTGRLFDRLQDVFEPQQLFLDVDNISPGADFVRELNDRIAECDVLLAVIGKGWINARDVSGVRRLDDPSDFVRIEITSALNQGKRVIPVLVGEASMPSTEELPEALRPLATRNAVRLTHERFHTDAQSLVKALQLSLKEIEAQRQTTREQTYRAALASEDPTTFRSFLATYEKGSDVDRVRRRLRSLERKQTGSSNRPAVIVRGALAAVLIAGGVSYWLAIKPRPSAKQPTTIASSVAVPAAGSTATQLPHLPTPISTGPGPDRIAWNLLRDTTDEDALKRFVTQYPNSALRNDADQRIATLEAARAARPTPPSPEQIAWNLVKDSSDPNELRRFVKEFPGSAERATIEQKIATLTAAEANAAPANNIDPHALALSLQFELKRVGCFDGVLNGGFDDATRAALRNFAKLASIKMPDELSPGAVQAVRRFDKRVCPLVCRDDERAEGDRCVTVASPHKTRPKSAETKKVEPHKRLTNAAAPRGNGKCFSFGGRTFCE